MNTALAANRLTSKEKEELIREVLGHKFNNAGNNLPVLKTIIDGIGHVDNVFTVAELITFSNALLTGSRFFTVLANGASVLSIFLSPVAHLITIINAWQTGHKMYAYRAIAYTLTAWAFNKPIPKSSFTVLSNLRTGQPVRKGTVIQEYNQVWQESSSKVLMKVQAGTIAKNVPKEAVKIILRALANNNPQKLCEMLLRGVEDQFETIPRFSWKANYKIRFPN